MPVYDLAILRWPAFRALSGERLIAVLPLGAIEAHGPHLPLGTDIFIANAMARAGADRLASRGFDVLVLPALPVSPAPFAAEFAGTIDIPAPATTMTILGIARSLARHGVGTTLIANAHHDPAHVNALRQAVAQVDADGSARLLFPDLTRRRWARRLSDEFQSGACHAGQYETSILMATSPESVDNDLRPTLAPNARSLVDAMRHGQMTFAAAGGPQAYFGAPADATADEGRDTIDRLGAIIEEAVLDAFADDGVR